MTQNSKQQNNVRGNNKTMNKNANVFLTNHAYERFKERAGIKKNAAERLTKRAYKNGIGIDEVKGSLKRYIASLMEDRYNKGSYVIVYGEFVYVFYEQLNSVVLVTMFWLPNNLKN